MYQLTPPESGDLIRSRPKRNADEPKWTALKAEAVDEDSRPRYLVVLEVFWENQQNLLPHA